MRSRSKRIKNVLSLEVARKRAWQPSVSKRSNQRLLERLEAENAQLRASVVDLMLQIQALRDGAR
jgi:cell division protein FtsB